MLTTLLRLPAAMEIIGVRQFKICCSPSFVVQLFWKLQRTTMVATRRPPCASALPQNRAGRRETRNAWGTRAPKRRSIEREKALWLRVAPWLGIYLSFNLYVIRAVVRSTQGFPLKQDPRISQGRASRVSITLHAVPKGC